ncbi:MAG: ECF transporter S component [Lachnospiraceae bacterium]|nr:ECF transporter S component [Lachnospiraceae bacterium]
MSSKKLCINALGIALFVVLTLCLQVPVFENYYLCLGYIAMAFYTYYFGITSGTLVGAMGVLLYCLLTSGLRGMPGWMLGNIIIGVLCGYAAKYAKRLSYTWMKQVVMAIAVILSTAIGILIVKSMVEVILYSLPFMQRIANNIYAFVADVIVLIIGFGICISGEGALRKVGEMNENE